MTADSSTPESRASTLILVCGLLLGLSLAPHVVRYVQSPASTTSWSAAPQGPPAASLPSPEALARPHLDSAAAASQERIDEHVHKVNQFFTQARRQVPEFARRALSWGSKWRLMADHVPYTPGDQHSQYLRSQFEELIFPAADLERLTEQVVAEYLADLRSIEGKMLVELRADLADFPTTYPVGQLDDAELQSRFNAAIRQAMAAAHSQLRSDISSQLVSLVAGEVLAQVAVRMGVSAGILGTGAASGWATFGVGVVVGLIVDQCVSWVWDWWANPRGDLTSELDVRLGQMQQLIADGDQDMPGLRQRLRSLAEERARLREEAILGLLAPPSPVP